MIIIVDISLMLALILIFIT